MTTAVGAADAPPDPASTPRTATVRVLVAIIAIALLAVMTALGYAWGNHGTNGVAAPSGTSVDAGFARDMSTHHEQAVTMAGFVRDTTNDPVVHILAYDIETGQQFQVGQMHGWLDDWGLPLASSAAPMAWMAGQGHVAANGLMPGMATPAEMTKLQSLRGKAMDAYFLQLMIRHHQGGLPMAEFGAEHAGTAYVRLLARSIVAAQSSEIVSMEQLLRQRGGTPLPAPQH